MKSYSRDQSDKRIDVELKKKELEKKFGAHFGKSDKLSPGAELEWLNYIEKFEQHYKNVRMTTVYEYIGKPGYKKIDDIDSASISEELDNLLNFLNEKCISLDTLCDVDDRELYRFITEELFFKEIEDMHIAGMMTCFIYEDFHPNAEYDICFAFDNFFTVTMAKRKNIGTRGYDLLYIDTENYLNSKGEKPARKQVTQSIYEFLDSFDYFDVTKNEIKDISINQDKTDALLTFDIDYRGCFKNSPEHVNYKGQASFRLRPSKHGGWNIYHINMPGWKF